MLAKIRRDTVRIVAFVLLAALTAITAPAALAAAPQPHVPAAIYSDAEAMLLKNHTDVVGADGSNSDAPPVAVPEDFMFRSFDINSDGVLDWRVNFRGVGYGFCGTGGCTNRLYVSRGDGSYGIVLDQQVLQMTIEAAQGAGALLTLGVHGTYCKGSGSIECLLAFRWNEAQFAFQPVATPRATVRLHGFSFLADDAHVPPLLKAELRKGDAECFRVTGKRSDEPAGSAMRSPDFDGDGRADWLLVGGYCAVEDAPMHGLATSLWLDRPDGLLKVLDWPAGGYSLDIGSVRPVFNGEGVDDCFYGMGECAATSFAWSTATQSMQAFPNASLAASDLAALTVGEALIAERFPKNVTAAQLARAVDLSERLAAVRAPIDPLLGRAWLVEGALRIARNDAAGAEAKLRRAKDVFAFAGEEFAQQRAMALLYLALAIDSPARRGERASTAQSAIGEMNAHEAVPGN